MIFDVLLLAAGYGVACGFVYQGFKVIHTFSPTPDPAI